MKIIFIIFFLCLASCATTKNDINPWTTIVRQVITNGLSR